MIELAKQAVKIFIRTFLPSAIGSRKINRTANFLVNSLPIGKLGSAITRYSFDGKTGENRVRINDSLRHRTCISGWHSYGDMESSFVFTRDSKAHL